MIEVMMFRYKALIYSTGSYSIYYVIPNTETMFWTNDRVRIVLSSMIV